MADVEVVAADGLGGIPFLLPVKLTSDVAPERGRVLNGLLVHRFILHKNKVQRNSALREKSSVCSVNNPPKKF